MSLLSRSLAGTLAGLALLALPARADTLKVPSKAFPKISDALSAAQPGDTVKIAPGSYVEKVLFVDVGGLTLSGPGAVLDGGQRPAIIAVAANDVTLRGLTLLNGHGAVQGDGARLSVVDCTFRGQQGFGIDVSADDLSVEGCTFDGLADDAIDFRSETPASTAVFVRNTFTRLQGCPIVAEGGRFVVERNRIARVGSSTVLRPSHTTQVSRFTGNKVQLVDDGALWARCEDAAGVLVEGNDVAQLSGTAFSLRLEDSLGSVVRKNRIRQVLGGCGVDVASAEVSSAIVEDNRIDTVADIGVLAIGDGLIVRRNTIRGTEDQGIVLRGSKSEISDNRLRESNSCGILVTANGGPGSSTVLRNVVRNAVYDGILVIGDGHEIADNDVKGVLGDGIEVASGAGNRVLRNTVAKALHEGLDNSGLGTLVERNRFRRNGLDVAGLGDGDGTLASFFDNAFTTGGEDVGQEWETTILD